MSCAAAQDGTVPVSQQLESYQDEIYLTGLTGAVPDLPADLHQLEAAARAVMTPQAYDYVAGSAGSGDTAAENLRAFRRWRLRSLRNDFELTMRLSGLASLTELGPDCLQRQQ